MLRRTYIYYYEWTTIVEWGKKRQVMEQNEDVLLL